jgi:decaprenylphospho-beta-D-ribofuranose 2-oxidase
MARGKNLGRSVLTLGEHAKAAQLSPKDSDDPLNYEPKILANVPSKIPSGLLNSYSVKAFNEMWFRKSPSRKFDELQSIAKFFHPLDGVSNWNRVYGNQGFIQYQFVVPDAASSFVRRTLEVFSQEKCPIFLAVLKRFGIGNTGYLSFPFKGWTLALDIPAKFPGLSEILEMLDQELTQNGGRLYLAKDSRMNPDYLEIMYPKINSFREVKSKVDPKMSLRNDLSQRLGIC